MEATSSGGLFLNAGRSSTRRRLPTRSSPFDTVTIKLRIGTDIASNPTVFLNLIGKVTGAGNGRMHDSRAAGTLTLSNRFNDFTGSLSISAGRFFGYGDHALEILALRRRQRR